MKRFFSLENPVVRVLIKLFDCIALTVFWAISSLPVVTIGAASTALYATIYHHVRLGNDYLWSTYLTAFRSNFKRSTLSWLPLMFMQIFLVFDVLWLRALIKNGEPLGPVYGIMLVLLCVSFVWGIFLFAYCARFNGRVRDMIRISFYLMMAHPLRTIGILLIVLTAVGIMLMVPGLAIILPSAAVWAASYPVEQIFLKHMRPEDAERTIEEQQNPDD